MKGEIHQDFIHEEPVIQRSSNEIDLAESIRVAKSEKPQLEARQTRSPEQIAAEAGVELPELENWLQNQAADMAESFKETFSHPDLEYMPLLDTLYNLFLYQKSNEQSDQNLTWLNKLESFESFCQNFCPDATPNAKSYIAHNIKYFMETHVHPSKIFAHIGSRAFGGEAHIAYQVAGDWTILPQEYHFPGVATLIEKDVIKEVIELLEQGDPKPGFSHGTGSAALEGIASHKAILSARESLNRGTKPVTGEFVSYIGPSGHSQSGSDAGLNSVYADQGRPRYGYHVVRWFNEFFVDFGINQERQEQYLEKINHQYEYSSHPKKLIADRYGEGTLIGPEVPLDNVDFIYCNTENIPTMEAWAKENCPQVKVLSLEAQKAITTSSNIMNNMAIQQGITAPEAWAKLIE